MLYNKSNYLTGYHLINYQKKGGFKEMAQEISEKQKALELALTQIERHFGRGAIMRLGEEQAKEKVPAIPTGSIAVDIALGVGGMPRGRVVEIFGQESSGKTTLSLSIAAQAQRNGGIAAFIDAEHALDPEYAKKIGVDVDNLYISQPDTGEQALEIADTLVRSGAVDIIIVDSVAALVPKAEIEGEMGDQHIGLQARLMSQALRKLTSTISKSKTTAIFINQIREKIGVMFGSPETTPGGRALKFYSSVRLEMRKTQPILKGEEVIGSRAKVKVVKNKVAPPFRTAEFDIMYDRGISYEGSLLEVGAEEKIIQQSGTWFSYGDTKLGQGKDNARKYLEENKQIADEIEKKIKEKFGFLPSGK